MVMLFERLIAVPLLVLFLVLSGCIAERLLYRCLGLTPVSVPAPTPATATVDFARILLQRILLGCGLLILLLFFAASTGFYRPTILVGLIALIAVLGGYLLGTEVRTGVFRKAELKRTVPLETESQAIRPLYKRRWLLRLTCLAFGILFFVLWLQSIRPDLSWDANVYHLTLAKLFLENGGFFSVPLNVYSHWPLGTELLFGLAMAAHDYILAKQLHFVFGLLTLFSLLIAARPQQISTGCEDDTCMATSTPRMVTWEGLLAASLFLANPVVLFEFPIAYIDLAFTFFFVSAFVVAERLIDDMPKRATGTTDNAQRTQLLLLGIACGLVCSAKLSGVLAALSILLIYWVVTTLHTRSLHRTLRDAPWILLPLLVLAAPWPIKSWWLTGNPAYPMFFDLFGGPDWSKELGVRHSAWQHSIGMGRSWLDYLLLPLRLITEGGQGYDRFDGRLHLAWLLTVPLSLWSAVKDPRQRRLLCTAAIYFAAWAVTSQQMRLLIPLLALLSISGARALRGTELSASRARSTALAVTTVLMVASCFFAAAPSLRQSKSLGQDLAFLGYRAKDAVIQPVYHAIRDLPETSQLLLLNTNHGFFIDRPYQADSFFEASQIQHLFAPLASARDAEKLLQQRGITHILIERRRHGLAYPKALLALIEDPTIAQLSYESPDRRYALVELVNSRNSE